MSRQAWWTAGLCQRPRRWWSCHLRLARGRPQQSLPPLALLLPPCFKHGHQKSIFIKYVQHCKNRKNIKESIKSQHLYNTFLLFLQFIFVSVNTRDEKRGNKKGYEQQRRQAFENLHGVPICKRDHVTHGFRTASIQSFSSNWQVVHMWSKFSLEKWPLLQLHVRPATPAGVPGLVWLWRGSSTSLVRLD